MKVVPILASLLPLMAAADQVLVVGSRQLLHESTDAAVKRFTPAGLAQLAMDAFGLPTGHVIEAEVVAVANPVQADIFQHSQAYAMVFVEGTQSSVLNNVESGAFGSDSSSFHKTFALENGVSAKIPSVVAAELKNARANAISVKCVGNSDFCNGPFQPENVDTAAVKNVFASNSFLNENDSADKQFAAEISQLNALTQSINKKSSDGAFYAIKLSGVAALSSTKRTEASSLLADSLSQFLSKLKQNYVSAGAQVVETTESMHSINDVMTYGRMLLDFNALSNATAANSTNGDMNVTKSDITMEDIAEYQIVLWTAVLLGAVLFMVIMALCNLDAGRDSLLYAKFIADVSSRKAD